MQSGRNEKTTKVVASEDQWNFSLLLSDTSPEGIQKDLARVTVAVDNFLNDWENDSTYLSDPVSLKKALDDFDNLSKNYGTSGNAGYYIWLKHSVDQESAEVKAQLSKVEEFSNKISNKTQFFTLRLAKVESSKQEEFLASPLLAEYKHFLEKLFSESKYLLSEPEEKILTLKSGPSHSYWTRMTSQFVSKQVRRGKTLPVLLSDLQSSDKAVRDSAAKDISEILASFADIAEHEMNAILADKKINDELRGITRPDLPRHLADDISSDVVDAMTNVVSSRFDIAHRFYKLRANILGKEKIAYHERLVPYGEIEKKYSFAQATKLVGETFSKIDPQFAQILEGYLDNGQIDVYPRLGKRGGAFCADELPIHPTFILLNHTGNLNDVLTLAHEVGHGINNELMRSQEKAVNFGSPLSTAEVASTFMEDFVLQKLLLEATPKERLAIYIHKLDDDVANIFRQVAAYNFEKDLHQSFAKEGFLSSKQIGQIFQKHMSSYMGPAVSQDPGTENWWIHWSHFRSFFYVYSYASGLLISKSLQSSVKSDPKFINSVKQILGAGSSDSPKNIFQKYANIDISRASFWTNGLNEVESLLAQAEKLWEEVK